MPDQGQVTALRPPGRTEPQQVVPPVARGEPRLPPISPQDHRPMPLGPAGRRLAVLLGAVLVLLLAGFAGVTWRDRDSALEDGWNTAEYAAIGVADDAERSLAAARLVGERVADAIRRDGPGSFRGEGAARLADMLRHAPQLGSIWVVDAAGRLVANSLDPAPPPADFSDRPFVAPLRAGADSVLSPLLWGPVSRLWFFGHNRAVRDGAGQLIGMVQMAIHAETFERIPERLGLGREGHIGLYRLPDGAPLMVHPLRPGAGVAASPPAMPGAPGPEVFRAAVERQATRGRFEAALPDGERLLVAWHLAGEGELLAAAAFPRARALAPFHARLARNAALLGLSVALLAGLGATVAAALGRGARIRQAAEAGRRELSALLEATGEGVVVVDRHWSITFLNARASVELAGGTELAGRRMWDAFPDLFGGPIWRACEEAMRCRATATAEARHPSLGRRFRVQAHPREDGGIVVFFRDVTDERAAAARLAESEARFRALFDAIDEGYCLCEIVQDAAGRPVDYRFLEVNPLFEAMTGLVGATGSTALDLRPELERHWIDTYARVALSGETLRFESRSAAMDRWFDVFAAPVEPRGRFALVFKDVTERRASEAALRENEAQLRRVLDNLFTFVGVLAPDGTLLEANRAPLEAAGLTLADVRGVPFWDCYWWSHDPAVQAGVRTACARAAAGHASRYDVEVRMAGDSRMTIDFQIAPLRDADGRITHLIPSATDVTKRREAEAALAESEARLRLAQEAADVGVFERDLLAGRAHWSAAMFRLYGLDGDGRSSWVEDAEYLALLHPDDRDAHRSRRDAMRADPAQSRFAFEFRIRRPDNGEVRWLASRGEVVRGADGQAVLVRGVNLDITERRRAEERQHLLAREVDHRAKNALAVVQSIVGLTRTADPEAFRAAVTGRIAAMARAHTLLAREGWDRAELRELAEAEVAPHRPGAPGGPERVSLSGPAVALAPGAAQPLAMALHELATNAVKYGALSSPTGHVAIEWHAAEDGGLVLRWTESGGPPPDGPPARRGFGSSVIRNTVERQLGGRTRFDWPGQGLACALTLPAQQLRWPGGPA